MLTTEHATIPGLELNTNYTISIMASACQTSLNTLVTNVLIKQKQGIAKIVYKLQTHLFFASLNCYSMTQ